MRARLIGVVCFGVIAMAIFSTGANAQDAKGKADVHRLIKELSDPNEKVSEAAVNALGETGLDAIAEVLKAFEKGDAKSRQLVVCVLGQLRHAAIKAKRVEVAESIETILLEALRDPNHMVVNKSSIALTSKEPRSKKAVPYFIEILRSDDKTSVARAAAQGGLERLGSAAAEAIPVLLHCFDTKIARKPEIEGKSSEEIRKALNNSKHYLVGERAALCYTLIAVGPKDERVVAAFSKALRNRKEEETVRVVSALLLSAMGEPGQAILPDLMSILKETSKNKRDVQPGTMRWAAVQSLAKLTLSKKEVAALVEIAVDRDESLFVRTDAVEAICNSADVGQVAWGPLLQMLQDENVARGLNLKAVIALGKIPLPAGADRPALVRELRITFDRVLHLNNRPELKTEIEKTLKKVGGP